MVPRQAILWETWRCRKEKLCSKREALFNLKNVNSQLESGSVAKDMMGKIQIHVFRQGIRRVNGMSSSDRKSAPLMICQPLTVVYSGIRSCELIPVAKGHKPKFDVSSGPSVPDNPAQSRGVISNKGQSWS
eukprot:1138731-Pelagomonas_calceolata.AAC.4